MLDVYFLNPFVCSWKLLSCMWDSWSWWENHLHFLSPFAKMGGTMKQLCHVWFLKLQLLKQTFQWVIKSSCPHFEWHWSFYSPCYRQPCWDSPADSYRAGTPSWCYSLERRVQSANAPCSFVNPFLLPLMSLLYRRTGDTRRSVLCIYLLSGGLTAWSCSHWNISDRTALGWDLPGHFVVGSPFPGVSGLKALAS